MTLGPGQMLGLYEIHSPPSTEGMEVAYEA